MNKNELELEYKIGVMQAAIHGKTIQNKLWDKPHSEFFDVQSPSFDWKHYCYRVKPITEENILSVELPKLLNPLRFHSAELQGLALTVNDIIKVLQSKEGK